MKRLAAALALTTIGLLGLTAHASAQQYPNRTVTIVCPYPAGGPADLTARMIANFLAKRFNQTFIVENPTGGGTLVGTNRVVKASPDGYTLLLHSLQISANATLYRKLPYDTEKDLTAVMMLNKSPLVLLGRKDLAPGSLPELLAYMKDHHLKAALTGFGATSHLATAVLAQEAKVQIDQIPYRGAPPAMNDLMGGHVDLFFATPQSAVPQVKAGALKAYGVTSKDTPQQLPNIDSFVKVLGPKLEIVFWQAMYAPAATPDAVINILNAAMQEAVTDPAIVKTWNDEGFVIYSKEERSPAYANLLLKTEIERWRQVIRDNNIHIDQ